MYEELERHQHPAGCLHRLFPRKPRRSWARRPRTRSACSWCAAHGGTALPPKVTLQCFDSIKVLEQWVENKKAPDRIVVSRVAAGKVVSHAAALSASEPSPHTRAAGSTDDAANFECRWVGRPQRFRYRLPLQSRLSKPTSIPSRDREEAVRNSQDAPRVKSFPAGSRVNPPTATADAESISARASWTSQRRVYFRFPKGTQAGGRRKTASTGVRNGRLPQYLCCLSL